MGQGKELGQTLTLWPLSTVRNTSAKHPKAVTRANRTATHRAGPGLVLHADTGSGKHVEERTPIPCQDLPTLPACFQQRSWFIM